MHTAHRRNHASAFWFGVGGCRRLRYRGLRHYGNNDGDMGPDMASATPSDMAMSKLNCHGFGSCVYNCYHADGHEPRCCTSICAQMAKPGSQTAVRPKQPFMCGQGYCTAAAPTPASPSASIYMPTRPSMRTAPRSAIPTSRSMHVPRGDLSVEVCNPCLDKRAITGHRQTVRRARAPPTVHVPDPSMPPTAWAANAVRATVQRLHERSCDLIEGHGSPRTSRSSASPRRRLSQRRLQHPRPGRLGCRTWRCRACSTSPGSTSSALTTAAALNTVRAGVHDQGVRAHVPQHGDAERGRARDGFAELLHHQLSDGNGPGVRARRDGHAVSMACITCINNTYIPNGMRLLAVAKSVGVPAVPDAGQRLHRGHVMGAR